MKNYTVEFIANHKLGTEKELLEYWKMDRERFTHHDYKNIIRNLFYFAAESCENAFLNARISENGKELFTIDCNTITEITNITAHININGTELRAMSIAS